MRWRRSSWRRCRRSPGSSPSTRYDVNHTHFIVPTGLLARLLKSWTGLPFVVTIHGSDVPGYNPDRFGLEHRLLGPLWRWILQRRRPSDLALAVLAHAGRSASAAASRSASSPTASATSVSAPMVPRSGGSFWSAACCRRKGVQYLPAGLARPRSSGLRGRHRRRWPLSADAQADGHGARPAGQVLGLAGQQARPSSRDSTSARRSSPSPQRPRIFRPCCSRRWRRARRSSPATAPAVPRSSATMLCWCRRAAPTGLLRR